MAANSNIEWCDHTFNPWLGCTRISLACDNCYAAVSTPVRTMGIEWGPGKPRIRTGVSNWKLPEKWNRAHDDFFAAHGRRQRVFCASLADVFDNEIDPKWRDDLFDLIRATPNLDWLLLTKRIGNASSMMQCQPYCKNVWLGATIANQEEADRDIPKLLATPAAVRFLSCEPLLGPINLTKIVIATGTSTFRGITRPTRMTFDCTQDSGQIGFSAIDWVIVGGESGPKARPCDVGWIRSIVSQCKNAGVATFVKQLGAHPTWDGCSGPDEHWPNNTKKEDHGNGRWEMRLRDRKGGDIREWPADLSVRQFPGMAT